MTVAELPDFASEADHLLGERSHRELIEFLGLNPEAGVVVPGTGGVRKLRWGTPGRGKRGGSRVIYYFHSENIPILALRIYAKNIKANLTPGERKNVKAEVHEYVTFHTGGKQ